LDKELRVKGVSGLRVLDASAWKDPPNAHIAAPTMAMGWVGAGWALEAAAGKGGEVGRSSIQSQQEGEGSRTSATDNGGEAGEQALSESLSELLSESEGGAGLGQRRAQVNHVNREDEDRASSDLPAHIRYPQEHVRDARGLPAGAALISSPLSSLDKLGRSIGVRAFGKSMLDVKKEGGKLFQLEKIWLKKFLLAKAEDEAPQESVLQVKKKKSGPGGVDASPIEKEHQKRVHPLRGPTTIPAGAPLRSLTPSRDELQPSSHPQTQPPHCDIPTTSAGLPALGLG
jgi:hypothetical protein